MSFQNKYEKKYKYFELFCKCIFLIAIDFDFLMFFVDPQMYIELCTIFPLLFHIFFAIFMLYSIILSLKPKVIIENDYLYVYSINKLNVKRKYQIENISNVVVNKDRKNKKYVSGAVVINMIVDNKIIDFALDEYDYEMLKEDKGQFSVLMKRGQSGDGSLIDKK